MKNKLIYLLLLASLIFTGCSDIKVEISFEDSNEVNTNEIINQEYKSIELKDIPEYSGQPYVVLNDNMPVFSK